MEKLFSYGTLQQENVQRSTFGRTLQGSVDTLLGYVVGEVQIKDQTVIATSGSEIHPILQFTGNNKDEVRGTVFKISAAELAEADKYEVEEYRRVSVRLKSGQTAWIYADAESND